MAKQVNTVPVPNPLCLFCSILIGLATVCREERLFDQLKSMIKAVLISAALLVWYTHPWLRKKKGRQVLLSSNIL
jgi:hypothetical protein